MVFARFVILLRQFNGIVAGTLEMHWARFIVYNSIGAVLWVGFWGLLAYWLGKGIHDLIRELHVAEPAIIAVVAFAAAIVAVVHLRRLRAPRDR